MKFELQVNNRSDLFEKIGSFSSFPMVFFPLLEITIQLVSANAG
jgi:hypothetical protein